VAKYRIELSNKARKFYETSPLVLAKRLDECFQELEIDPYHGPRIKRLKTGPKEKLYRYRLGDFRIIYEIYEMEIIVLVLKIAKREDAYKTI
jgi:mRNA interferase RelE/StbE